MAEDTYTLDEIIEKPDTVFLGNDNLYYQFYEGHLESCPDPYCDDPDWSVVSYEDLASLDFYFEYSVSGYGY